jgi:6,7-dimethyl-8-ribityllumazine synthase
MTDTPNASHLRVALVVSRYNAFVTDRLRDGAVAALTQAGTPADQIEVCAVPGAYEIPQAARRAAETGRFDAVVCLGCIIRGETPHFEYIASAVADGIMRAAAETGVPMTFGVLTTESAEQALARAAVGPDGKGWEAAASAVELATLFRQVDRTAGRGPRE